MILVNDTPVTWGHPEQGGTFPSLESKPVINFDINDGRNVVHYAYDPAFRSEMMEVFSIAMLLRDKAPQSEKVLVLDYIPNARMDKPLGKDFDHDVEMAPLNLYTAQYFNLMGFDEIIGIEPHSEEFEKCYAHAKARYATMVARNEVIEDIRKKGFGGSITWVFPDDGSRSRYETFFTEKSDCITMKKVRKNGQIESLSLGDSNNNISSENIFIIVDDICSRGSTAHRTAETLRKYGATKVFLLVAYLESSVLGGPLLRGNAIDGLYVARRCVGQEILHKKVQIMGVTV